MVIRVQNQGARLKANSQKPKEKERKITSFLLFFFLLTFNFLLPKETTRAQPTPSLPMFQNVTIGPKFSPDPMTIQGISGGSVPISQITGRQETANGPCVGFVDEKPDHTIVLTSFFSYLSLQVQSPEDTTIMIGGPGGSWCNDDSQGKNPGIAGQWLPGTYGVWVGSYRKDRYHPYILRITQVH